jgi:hypothetical protein
MKGVLTTTLPSRFVEESSTPTKAVYKSWYNGSHIEREFERGIWPPMDEFSSGPEERCYLLIWDDFSGCVQRSNFLPI